MVDPDLAFERSEVDASVLGKIAGIKNPYRGRIVADAIEDILPESPGKKVVYIAGLEVKK